MNNYVLDDIFLSLIPKINDEDKEKLTNYIIKNNIVPEITVWKNYVVDGHFTYMICQQYHLDFKIKVINLHNKLHAMNWICEKQLTRKDLPKCFEWYLIGKRYLFEQAHCVARYSKGEKTPLEDKRFTITHEAAQKLSQEYKISRTTVMKYGNYAKGVDIMKRRDYQMAEMALYGEIDISQNNMILLGCLSNAVYATVRTKIIRTEGEYLKYDFPAEYGNKEDQKPRRRDAPLPEVSVKNMPKYDPGSKLSTLFYTIPTWGNTIERTITETDFDLVPQDLKEKLLDVVSDFLEITTILLEFIKE